MPTRKPWTTRVTPFKIADNLYFAGNQAASAHLIDTGEGLILIDTGYPQTLYLLIQSIWELGFHPSDVKYILHSHGHYDHLGGTRAFVELTGAKTFIGRHDADFATGRFNAVFEEALGASYHGEFVPDVLLKDGDVVSLGDTRIDILETPGHTPGTISFFFDVAYGGRTYRAGMHGGVGLNGLTVDHMQKYGYSYECREQFLQGLERLKNERVDIFIGNHTWNNDTLGKAEVLAAGGANPFINPLEWGLFLEKCKEDTIKLLEEEK